MPPANPQTPSLFYQNEALFGHRPTPRIVAAEFDGRQHIEVFTREGDSLRREKRAFRPFVLVSDLSLLFGFEGKLETTPLSGSADLRYLAFASDWKEGGELVRILSRNSKKAPGDPSAPFFFASDPVHQHLLLSGETLFKEMRFEDLIRMQMDIETSITEGFEFPNPVRKGDRIAMIAVSDSRGFERVLSGPELSEPEVIRALIEIVQGRDPDVLEGHNLFNFDLEYLAARAKRHGIRLALGRDRREARSRPSRLQIAERTIAYTRFDLFGRHLIDTLFLVQMYDASAREIESYGLKDVARHFKLSPADRVLIEPDRINWYLQNDLERARAYCLADALETRALSGLLSPSFFYQAQIFPFSFQNVILRGNATKIDSLFMREYLHRRRSVPLPPPPKEFAGGYTDLFEQGVLFRVLNCDVQSLYPSIILTFGHAPKSDGLKVFPALLADLKKFRLQAKEMARRSATEQERHFYEAVQGTFKILINSFYGYLGFSLGHFADFNEAQEVTARGRALIRQMVGWLSERGCRVIEIDTDGIYFVPPAEIQDARGEESLVEALSKTLPEGIRLELTGRYRAMFSYKMKNYVLLSEGGEMIIKGSGLKSRGLEPFQRRFMEELFALLLTERPQEAPSLLERYRTELREHRWNPKMFSKTETLSDSLSTYQEKVKNRKRNMSAAYELALRSERAYQPGDAISFYVTGTRKNVKVFEACKPASSWDPANPDENTAYYDRKLLDLYEKFRPFLENPSPTPPGADASEAS